MLPITILQITDITNFCHNLDKPVKWAQNSQLVGYAGKDSVQVLACFCDQISSPGWHWDVWEAVAGSSLKDVAFWKVLPLQRTKRGENSNYTFCAWRGQEKGNWRKIIFFKLKNTKDLNYTGSNKTNKK